MKQGCTTATVMVVGTGEVDGTPRRMQSRILKTQGQDIDMLRASGYVLAA